MKLEISNNLLREFDDKEFSPKYKGIFKSVEGDGRSGTDDWPFFAMERYHKYYVILGYFSTHFNNSTFVELGTRRGHGTASLAFNPSNTVYTYNNVYEEPENDVFNKFDNINSYILSSEGTETPLGNVLDSEEHANKVLNSDLIFVDVDPHDGTHEQQLFSFLSDNNYKGITLWDDINHQLSSWWAGLSNHDHVRLFDLKSYSWADGGTGVACFGDQEIILQ
jgi:hypothetical protein